MRRDGGGPFRSIFPFFLLDLLYSGSCAMRNLGSSPSPPGQGRHRLLPGPAPLRDGRPRPGPGAPGGGRARQGLREALSRLHPPAKTSGSASERGRLAAPSRCPGGEAAPGSASRRPPAPGSGEKGRPRAHLGLQLPGPGGRRGARRGGGAAAAPARPLPAPGPAGPVPRPPRAPRPRGWGALEGRRARAPLLLKTRPADTDAQAGCPLSWSGPEPLPPRGSLLSPFL